MGARPQDADPGAPGLRDDEPPVNGPQDAGPQDLSPLAADPFRTQSPPPDPARRESHDDDDDGEESPLSPWRFH